MTTSSPSDSCTIARETHSTKEVAMKKNEHFIRLFDRHGNLHSVQLSAELWQKGGQPLHDFIDSLFGEDPTTIPEPVEEWEQFKKFWDFEYPLCSDVECKACGCKVSDWQTAPGHPFVLKSAQLGGLVVFLCKECGAIVRKKHFKDHICFEASSKTK